MKDNNPIKYSDLISPDNSITDLIKQLDELGDAYKTAIKNIKSEAIELTATLKGVSGATDEGRKATKKASDEADKLARAQKDLAFAESENAKKLAELKEAQHEANTINKLLVKLNQSAEGSYNHLSAQYSLNKIYINNMTQAERDEAEEKEGLITKTRELYEEMKKMQEVTGKHQLNVGNYTQASDAIIDYGERLKESLGLNSAFGESILALGKGGAEAKSAMQAIGDGAKALGKSLLTLMTNPVFLAIAGIAAAGTAFKWWYDYNQGLIEATRLTQQFTEKEGDDLKAYRNEVQAVADTFGKDFREVLISMNALQKQFGITSEEALQLIKDGFIAGADANGEFLDSVKEYPAYFKEAGISASQFIAIVAQTNKAGIFSDKGIDAIKEANLRLREMTTATAAALDGIGISSKGVMDALSSGAKSTFQIMQEISARLAELPASSTQVGTAIADIFGGPGEDAGLQYLTTLKDISTDLDEVKDKAGKLGEIQAKQLQAQADLQNSLSAIFDATGGSFEEMIANGKVFVSQTIASMVRGIIRITNSVIDMYNRSEAIRTIWANITTSFKTQFDAIGNLFNYFGDILAGTGRALKGAFTLDTDLIEKGLKQIATALPKMVNQTVKDFTNNLNEGLQNAQKKIEPIKVPVVAETTSTPTATTTTTTRIEKVEVEEEDTEDLSKKMQEEALAELRIQKETNDLRLKAVKAGTEEEMQLRLKGLEIAEQIALATSKADSEAIKDAYAAEKAKLADSYLQAELKIFDEQQALEESEFDLMKTTEAEKTRYKLQAEKERWQKILELNELSNQKLSDAEVQTIKNTIAKIDGELSSVTEKKEGAKDIYEVFGINLSDEKKSAISTSLSFAKEQLNDYINAYVEAADRKVEKSNEEVSSAQAALQAEIEARNGGYANNVQMAQKELELAKKNQEKALKEQQKAQKAQAAVQAIQQAGDLITASAMIWSQLGFPWAIPAIAVMWGSFAAAKIKAAQVTKESYGEGTVELLEGGSHQSGNDIDLGTKEDGTRRRAEGGEFFAVINKRNSRRFRKEIPDIIHSLNDGTFAEKYVRYDSGEVKLNVVHQNPDLNGISDDVKAIKEQGQRRVYTRGDGATIEQYKNLTRVLR